MADSAKPYGVFSTNGTPVYIGLHADEDAVWQIYLGWPSLEEIDEARHQGLRVSRIIIYEKY